MTNTALAHIDDAPLAREIVPTDRKLLPAPMEQLQEVGALIQSAGALVNKDLRQDPGACVAVAYMAALHGTDPIATASQAFLINGRLAFMAQYISALIRKHLTEPLDITFHGEGAQRYCRVVGKVKGKVLEYTSPRVAVITPKNSSLWRTDPDQQLGAYYSVRAFARRHMPDVLLGVYAVDELQSVQIKDVTPVAPDPFADDGAELEHVEPEEDDVTPEPSGGADYTTAQKPQERGQERQQRAPAAEQPKREQWPLNDDPMAFFALAEAAVAEADSETYLAALWQATEANRRALFDADPISSQELDEAFNTRLKEVKAGQ